VNQDEISQQKNTILFTQLLLSLHGAAMHYLGKLVDPAQGEASVDLDQARVTIDTLDMLKAKSTGNLSTDESRFLDQILADLKLNYVDESNRKIDKSVTE
jgi:hypothetical protein